MTNVERRLNPQPVNSNADSDYHLSRAQEEFARARTIGDPLLSDIHRRLGDLHAAAAKDEAPRGGGEGRLARPQRSIEADIRNVRG